jgi:uncharacterized protein (TIGR02466 family)
MRAGRLGWFAMTSTLRTLFATDIYLASFADEPDFSAFNAELKQACLLLATEDRAGRAWCKDHGYKGYTSYASLNDLPQRATVFANLKKKLDLCAADYAAALAFDLGGRRLKLDSLWVNVLEKNGAHSGHIHPSSVLSGTVYVEVPKGAGALKLEDPRLPLMMAAPQRRADAPEAQRRFVYLEPHAGAVFIWESWLRHEVTPNAARTPRISLSFNYA